MIGSNQRGTFRYSGPHQPGAFPWRQLIHGRGTTSTRPRAHPSLLGYYYYDTTRSVMQTCVLSSGRATWTDLTLGPSTTDVLTPSQITADQNDYEPSGINDLGEIATLRLDTDANRTLTGLKSTTDSYIRIISNIGSNPLTLKHESTSSSAANRFSLGGGDRVIPSGGSIMLRYDGTSSRYRMLSDQTQATGEIGPFTLTANVNDWNPSGLSTASVVYFTTDALATYDITGLAGGWPGRIIYLINTGSTGAETVNLVTESGSSSAANRFYSSTGATTGMSSPAVNGPGAILRYSGTHSRWQQIGIG